MNPITRMSPLTAFFLGLFGVGGLAIAAGTVVLLTAMTMVEGQLSTLVHFSGKTIESLPELLDSLPPVLADTFHDRRDPAYAARIDVKTEFLADEKEGSIRPVLTITNTGSEVVSLLGVRVAALKNGSVPIREWTEVVATPITPGDDEWRGPLMPGAKRHVVLRTRALPPAIGNPESLIAATEISEIRVWQGPNEERVARNP